MTGRRKILVAPSSFGVVDRAPLERLEQAGLEVISNPYGRKLTKEELQKLLPGVIGIVAGLEPLTREILEGSDLKVISRCGVGLSNVDLEAAATLGIAVRSTPDAPTLAVAELTLGAMLSVIRRIPQMDHDLHEGRWVKQVGTQLCGKTVVIIGFGRIGRKLADLLKPLDVAIVAVDSVIAPAANDVTFLSLGEALKTGDIVTLHASGESQILGDAEFALMKPGVHLLNSARGGLINESALCRALEGRIVAGAWLDTFGQEPYSGPLLGYPQVILTPHVGSSTAECRSRMERESVENLLVALQRVPGKGRPAQ